VRAGVGDDEKVGDEKGSSQRHHCGAELQKGQAEAKAERRKCRACIS